MRAPSHPRQRQRLKALHDYRILDTPREQDFDEIVDLASRICETPISVVNLIDEARQWFKAEVGLNTRETPLETSICSHIILQDDFVEIPDTLADQRMADNPLCIADGGLRFYAGARLLASNGLPIGTLCVLDTRPRTLTDLQRDTLRVLSRQVMKQLELRLALHNQRVLQAEMDHRVKNSLHSVSAIVRVYKRTVEDAHGKSALSAVQRRVDAVAALHAQLQNVDATETVNMDSYLCDIRGHLQAAAPDGITLDFTCDDIRLPANQAASVGMIVSEFTANALKHGFPRGRAGSVTISLRRLPDGQALLTGSDDGVGLSTAQPKGKAHGIGMSLLTAAGSQLGGTLTTDLTTDGGRLSLTFPLDEDG